MKNVPKTKAQTCHVVPISANSDLKNRLSSTGIIVPQ